jgi:hypothetical protein
MRRLRASYAMKKRASFFLVYSARNQESGRDTPPVPSDLGKTEVGLGNI